MRAVSASSAQASQRRVCAGTLWSPAGHINSPGSTPLPLVRLALRGLQAPQAGGADPRESTMRGRPQWVHGGTRSRIPASCSATASRYATSPVMAAFGQSAPPGAWSRLTKRVRPDWANPAASIAAATASTGELGKRRWMVSTASVQVLAVVTGAHRRERPSRPASGREPSGQADVLEQRPRGPARGRTGCSSGPGRGRTATRR